LQARSGRFERDFFMLDVIVLAMGLVFFALSIGYAYACDRL
jgi:SNF family Na+-dependent transporter